MKLYAKPQTAEECMEILEDLEADGDGDEVRHAVGAGTQVANNLAAAIGPLGWLKIMQGVWAICGPLAPMIVAAVKQILALIPADGTAAEPAP